MSRITVIVPLPPSYRGGTEEYAYQLAGRYANKYPVQVLTTTVRWDPTEAVIDTGSARIERLPGREVYERPVVTTRGAYLRLRQAVRSSTIVQLHMPFPRVERWVTAWAVEANVPVVLTYHMDAETGGGSPGPIGRIVRGLYRRFSAIPALTQSRVVVSNSWGYAQASPVLSQFLPKVRVIHKGVDPVRLGLGATSRDHPPPPRPSEAKRVVFVGRLVAYKGVPLLIDAVAALNRGGLPVTLDIAGTGPLADALRSQIRALGLENRVRLLGFVSDEQLGDLYRSADVVACPSLNRLEATPTSLEEALACGTPVVGSSLPGTEETVPNDGVRGLLVPPNDVSALEEGLRRLLAAPHPMNGGPVRTWEDVCTEYLALFHELAPDLDR